MDIIFVRLPKYLVPISILLRKLGNRVFFLKLSGYEYSPDLENTRINTLKDADVIPLPLEDIIHFDKYSYSEEDPRAQAFKNIQHIAPTELLRVFEGIFPDIPNLTKKLQIAVHAAVVEDQINLNINVKINIWARIHSDRNILLIDVNYLALLSPEPAQNVHRLVIPFDVFANGISTVFSMIYDFLTSWKNISGFKEQAVSPITPHSEKRDPPRVALVTHNGLSYGKLFPKDLYFSNQPDSDFNPERLLYIDYNGWASPSEKLNWVCMGNHRQTMIKNIRSAVFALKTGISHVRNLRHILTLIIITQRYIVFKSFLAKLEAYSDLKIALIDYEVLCPKELLLAFECKGVKTIATQERFFDSFDNMFAVIIMNHYLCASQYAADAIKRSPLNCIDHLVPVGQYRSDNMIKAKNASPPDILKPPLAKGCKIVTALGFHTVLNWQDSQTEILLNWKAHKHFLDDMIRLSQDIPDIFVILRYKFIDWISLPVFSETVQKIQNSHNIAISTDYETPFLSYDLCAHSHLVIAKLTSIADESLSVGIPVLFHEYTHNTEILMTDRIDYKPTRIACYNYMELKERAKIVLDGTPNVMTGEYEYLKKVIYGGLGDGKVRKRVHAYIEDILSKL